MFVNKSFSFFGREALHIMRLGIPLMIAHVAMVGLEVVDTMMAGQVSSTELAGLAVGANIWLVIELFMGGWISATTPRFARLKGAGKPSEIRHEAQQAILMALGIGTLAMLLIWSIVPLLSHLGTSSEVTEIAQSYLSIIAWGMPASGVIWVMLCLCEGCGDIRFSLGSSLIVLALNAVLDYIFVFGKFGMPAMGAVGCALTTLSIYFLWAMMGVAYIETVPEFKAMKVFRSLPRLDLPRWRAIFMLGLPISLSLLAEEGFFSVTALLIAPLGTDPLGAHQITLQIVALVLMLSLGLGQATSIRLSSSIGSGKPLLAARQAKVGLSICLSYAFVFGLLIAWQPGMVISLFTQDSGIANLSLAMLVFAPMFLLIDSAQVSVAQILRGFEDTKVPMMFQVFGYWCLGFPLGYSLGATDYWGENYGIYGYWSGFLAGIIVSAILLNIRLQIMLRRLVEPTSPELLPD
ncbi:MATE family efflux transporter [Pseudoteredinibacter isoporae]|uniref:MATE family efflux transporter n=1 Tax=Pseudoteredinibacter isoporae TaxID=570281 RepID=UPI003108F3D2